MDRVQAFSLCSKTSILTSKKYKLQKGLISVSLQKLEMNGALSLSFPAEKEWSRGNYPQSIKILDYRSLSNRGSTEKNWTKWQYFVLLSSLRTDISGRNEQALFWSTFWTVVVVEKGGDRFPSRDIDFSTGALIVFLKEMHTFTESLLSYFVQFCYFWTKSLFRTDEFVSTENQIRISENILFWNSPVRL